MANRFLSNIKINDAYTFPASDGTNGQFIATDGAGNLSFQSAGEAGATVIYKDLFTGDASTLAFTLANSVDNEIKTQVYFDGVYQSKENYTVSGSTITFSTAPPSGAAIEVITFATVAAADYNQKLNFYGKAVGAITKGDAVMFAGAEGDHFLVAKATQAALEANHEYFLGLAAHDFVNNQYGYVTQFGRLEAMDTSDYTAGDILWFDSEGTVAGAITTTEPAAPNTRIQIAAVVRVHQEEGVIFIRPTVHHELGETTDVSITSVADKDLLAWNAAGGVWENTKTLGDITTGDITTSGTVDGVDVSSFKSAYDSHNHDDRYYTELEVNGLLSNSANWDTAYSWGDHSLEGYLTSFTETDPIYTASSWYTTTNNSTNWNTAYGWGNHAGLYLPIGARYTGNASDINVSSYRLWDVSTATDDPSGAVDGLLLTGYWDSLSWATQQYHDFHTNTLFIRNKYSGTWQEWKTIIDSSNIGSQSVANAGTLDSLAPSQFLRSDESDTITTADDTRLTLTDSGDSSSLTLRADTTNSIYSNKSLNIYTEGTQAIYFSTNGQSSQRAAITSSGHFVLNSTTVGGGTEADFYVIENGGLVIDSSESTTERYIEFTTGGTTKMILTAGGYLGIGQPIPTEKLNIKNSSGDAGILLEGSSQTMRIDQNSIRTTTNSPINIFTNNTSGANSLYIENDGRFGIGTTTPTSGTKLDVWGKIRATDDLILAQTNPRIDYDGGNTGYLRFLSTSTGSVQMALFSNGNLGLGNTNNVYKLEVTGTALVSGEFLAGNGYARLNQYDNGLNGAGEISLWAGSGTGWAAGDGLGRIRFYTNDGSGIGARDVAKIEAVSEDGNGTSTTTPSGALVFYTSPYNANIVERVRINGTGNVEIKNNLSVGTEIANNGTSTLTIRNYDTTLVDADDIQGRILFSGRYWSDSNSQLVQSSIQHGHALSNGNGGSFLSFSTQTGGDGLVEQMRIDRIGNVGIGTTTPSVPLTVQSNSGGIASRFIGRSSDGYAFLSFRNNADTVTNGEIGISDAQNMLFYTGASPRMSINSAGNVGIGVTSPEAPLHVYSAGTANVQKIVAVLGSTGNRPVLQFSESTAGTITAGMSLEYNGNGSGDANYMVINSVANVPRFTVTSGGFVGIGTTSPGAKLDVVGDTYIRSGNLFADGIRPYTGDQLSILNGGNNSLYINGNVGIGVTSPAAKLDVGGNALFRVTDGSQYTGAFTISNDATGPSVASWSFNSSPIFLVTTETTADAHIAANQSTEDANGVVIRGYKSRGSAANNLSVANGDSILTIDAWPMHTAGPNVYKFGGGMTWYKDDGGGTASTYAPVSLRWVMSNSVTTTITAMTLTYNGNLSVYGSVTAGGDVTAYSDARVKENIETIDNALDKVIAMRGVSYNRTDREDKSKKVGVIAQEIQKVLPEVVSEQEDGMLGVSYGNIVGVLIEAIKELSNKVEELENKLNGNN